MKQFHQTSLTESLDHHHWSDSMYTQSFSESEPEKKGSRMDEEDSALVFTIRMDFRKLDLRRAFGEYRDLTIPCLIFHKIVG